MKKSGEEQVKYVSAFRRRGEERMTIKRGGGGRRVAKTTRTSGGGARSRGAQLALGGVGGGVADE